MYLQPQNDGSATPGLVSGVATSSWTALSNKVSLYLADKIPVGSTVTIQPPAYASVYLSMSVTVKSSYRNNAIKLAIVKKLLNDGELFSFDQNSFGRTIPLSKVIATVASIEGVDTLTITKMNTDNGASAATISLSSGQVPYLLPENLVITEIGRAHV